MNRIRLRPRELSYPEFFTALGTKWILGCLYGYIYLHYYQGDDTWKIFEASVREKNLLLSDSAAFFRNEYTPIHSIAVAADWKEATWLYINDLQYALLVKSLAFINLLTRDNYYLDVLLFNLVVFFGQYRIFLIFKKLYPEKRKVFYLGAFYFLPAVFWLSGLRVDGLVLFFLSLFLYNLLHAGSKRTKLLYMFIGSIGLLICRAEMALLLLPAAIAYLLALKQNALKSFVITYGLTLVLFFAPAHIPGMVDIPGKVANVQHKFLSLEGTRFHLDTLDSSIASYTQVLPQAFANTFFRPFVWEAHGLLQFMAAVDILLFWFLVGMFILNAETDWKRRLSHPVIFLLLFLSFIIYLAIGFTVPFPGAIIRYKAIPELLFIMCVISLWRNNKLNF